MIRVSDLGFRYAIDVALRAVDLELHPGEKVLLSGPSGCGKSTLLRCILGLARGRRTGDVQIDARDPSALAPRARAASMGFVAQDPSDQVVAGTIRGEIGFGPAAAGWSSPAIDRAVTDGLDRVGLAFDDTRRNPRTLSGGQLQRVATAAGLAVGATHLLLDEPLAQLDPEAADSLLALLARLATDGTAVLLAEHRVGRCLPWADRLVVLARGQVVYDGPPDEEVVLEQGLDLAPDRRLDRLLATQGHLGPPRHTLRRPEFERGPRVIDLPRLRRERADGFVLDLPGRPVFHRERIALVGRNGSGKSTLLEAILAESDLAMSVPQDPDLSLFSATVRAELAYAPTEQRHPSTEIAGRVQRAAASLSIDTLLEHPPQALSRGQRLRVAVAAALCARPHLLLLDEPTAGQDRAAVERMFDGLTAFDGAVIFATHDLDLALRRATRLWVLDAGSIVYDGLPDDALGRSLPVPLPDLARRCHALGLPYLPVSSLVEAW